MTGVQTCALPISPLVEGLSLDEAFLDVTASRSLFGGGQEIAERIRTAIRTEVELTASAGVATSKFVAKVASDLRKPDGLVVVPDDVAGFLAPLPIERMWGIGPKTAPRLRELGYKTLGDLARANVANLSRVLGQMAQRAIELSRGDDDRPVVPHGEAKSIGSETTYEEDLSGEEALSRAILGHSETVARRLTAEKLVARTVTVKLKLADFTLLTRQLSTDEPLNDTQSIHEAGKKLLGRFQLQDARIRLVGVSVSGLSEEPRMRSLFPDPERERRRRIEGLVGALHEKHGGAITRATLLEGPKNRATWVGVSREELAKVASSRTDPKSQGPK